MLTIITVGRTAAEQAAITVAREAGIRCEVVRPQRRGPDRRGYRKCLQAAADSDGSLVLGNKLTPSSHSANLKIILAANKPTSLIATRIALMFPSSPAATRRWMRKWRIKKLHIAGRAPKAMAAKFLRAVLAGYGAK